MMDPVMAELLNEAQEPALQLGQRLSELGAVVVESVLGKQATVADPLFTPTGPDELIDEFGVLPHIAVELRVALSESEAYLTTALLTLNDAKTLLGLDLNPDNQIALKSAEKLAGELGDLIALMLFTDSPLKGGVKVSEVRYDQIQDTVGMLLDVSQGSPLTRLEYDLVDGDVRTRVTHIVPVSLVSNLALRLSAAPEPEAGDSGAIAQDEIDALAGGLSFESDSPADNAFDPEIDVSPAKFASFEQLASLPEKKNPIDLVLDVSLRVSVELGRTVLTVQDVLGLGPGSVVELDKLAGEPVDIYVNDRLIAKGEVVVVDENFGVRVTEIVPPTRRQAAA